jgi:hypothetical protein
MSDFKLFLGVILTGFVLEFIFYRVVNKFFQKPVRLHNRFVGAEQISFISIPIWGLLALIIKSSTDYLGLFLYSALVGTGAEYLLGWFAASVFRHKIYSYSYAKLGDYTSYFSIPFWGGAGVLFYLIGQWVHL